MIKMQKIQERVLHFVLNNSACDYDTVLTKCDVDCFQIPSLKAMAVEIYAILNKSRIFIFVIINSLFYAR